MLPLPFFLPGWYTLSSEEPAPTDESPLAIIELGGRMDPIFVGDTGVGIRIVPREEEQDRDLSAATVRNVYILRPDRTVLSYTGVPVADSEDGVPSLQLVTPVDEDSAFTHHGAYMAVGYLEDASGKRTLGVVQFEVYPRVWL